MGTIMTVCMALGVVALTLSSFGPLATRKGVAHTPHPRLHVMLRVMGGIVLLAGLWNTLWHAPRHLGQFWGHAALGSGLLMLLAAACLLAPTRLPPWVKRLRPLVLLGLIAFMLLYGVTIYRL